jgi:ubiquitin-conjugating enzyme E2 variant
MSGALVSSKPPLFSPGFKFLEVLAILSAVALGYAYLPRLEEVGLLNIPIGLAMLVTADLLSGVAHWAFDRWGDEKTFLIGPNIIRSFREHHTDQLGITRHSFVESNGGPAMGTLPLLLLGLSIPSIYSVCFMWIALFIVLTNVFHAWAHGRAPAFARTMQRAGLVLQPAHHALHHKSPHDRAYCITTGWCNPILDYFQVWSRLERLITATTGVEPCQG